MRHGLGSSVYRTRCRGYSSAAPAASIVDQTSEYKPGQQLHGYTVQKVACVPELYLTAVKLSHNKTGAEHLHVARDDSNDVFG